MANETIIITFVITVINIFLINGDTSAITSIAHRHRRY
jgi:hypothetical protein